MKVLFIHTAYQFKGGEDTVVAEEIRLLRENSVEVEQLVFSNNTNALLKLVQLPFNFQSYKKVQQVLKRFRPDVVHLHNFHFAASPSVIYAVKNLNYPLVITLHNFRLLCPSATLYFNGSLFQHSLHQSFPWKAVSSGVYKGSRLITFWLGLSNYLHNKIGTFNQCDRCIVLTTHALQLFKQSSLRLSADKMILKPNFCEAPPLNTLPRGSHFLYVGRLSAEKGIQTLMEAFNQTDHHLIIAGDGPLKKFVEEAASKNNNIQYAGSLPRHLVVAQMQNASALIFPSTWFEGMPLTIIEAFACGLPVIATNLGAMQTMITHQYNGLHFSPEDSASLLHQVAAFSCLNQAEKNTYATNAFKTYSQLYTPQNNADILLKMYSSLQQEKHDVSQLPALAVS